MPRPARASDAPLTGTARAADTRSARRLRINASSAPSTRNATAARDAAPTASATDTRPRGVTSLEREPVGCDMLRPCRSVVPWHSPPHSRCRCRPRCSLARWRSSGAQAMHRPTHPQRTRPTWTRVPSRTRNPSATREPRATRTRGAAEVPAIAARMRDARAPMAVPIRMTGAARPMTPQVTREPRATAVARPARATTSASVFSWRTASSTTRTASSFASAASTSSTGTTARRGSRNRTPTPCAGRSTLRDPQQITLPCSRAEPARHPAESTTTWSSCPEPGTLPREP